MLLCALICLYSEYPHLPASIPSFICTALLPTSLSHTLYPLSQYLHSPSHALSITLCALQELTVAVHAVVGTAPIDVYLKALRRKQLEEYHAAFEGEGHLSYPCMTPLSLSSTPSPLLPLLYSTLSLLLFQVIIYLLCTLLSAITFLRWRQSLACTAYSQQLPM